MAVYIICVLLRAEIIYTTTAPEIRPMPDMIGISRESRIPLGALVVYTAAARILTPQNPGPPGTKL